MIRLVEAPPRSGKTFYVVHYLTKFCKYSPLYKEWTLTQGNVLIVSNIAGLKIRHVSLKMLVDTDSEDKVFTLEYFIALKEKYHVSNIILCIDEAYDYFPKTYKNPAGIRFFSMHGHEGIDIFLMTQNIVKVCPQIVSDCEYIVRVSIRSRSVPGSFQYKFYDKSDNTFLGSESLKKDQRVFQAYKSFSADEFSKPKSALTRYAVMFVLLIAGAFLFFKSTLASISSGPKHLKKVSSAPGPSGSPKQGQASSSKVAIFGNHSAVAPLPLFMMVPVDGYYKDSGRTILIVRGRIIRLPSPLVKHFDANSLTAVVSSALAPTGGEATRGATAPQASGGAGGSLTPAGDVRVQELRKMM